MSLSDLPEDFPSLKQTQKIRELRDRIFPLCRSYIGKVMDLRTSEIFAASAEHLLIWPGTRQAIATTLGQYSGFPISESRWRQLCWQIAANRSLLSSQVPLVPFHEGARPEWVAMEICSIAEETPNFRFGFRAITGQSTGFVMKSLMSIGGTSFMARQLGFTNSFRYPNDPMYLFGLYFIGYIVDMKVDRFVCERSYLRENKEIIKWRRRDFNLDQKGNPRRQPLTTIGCPQGHQHDCWDCHLKHAQCKAGY